VLIPIRCFTCGALIADRYEKFKSKVERGESPRKVLDELGIKRYCCRRMLISAVEPIDEMLVYYEVVYRRRQKEERTRDVMGG